VIPRYSRQQMQQIWEPENRFKIWFEIERHALEAQVNLGLAPKSALKDMDRAGRVSMSNIVDHKKIEKIERKTRHDVIAFLTNLATYVGKNSRFVHQGLTSSDVLDTCLAVQMTQATDLLLKDLESILIALKNRALEHKNTICVGRSHGIHAEPTTFGLKLAGHYAEFERNHARLLRSRDEIATCAISGPVGTYSSVDPKVEKHVAKRLGLKPEPLSTQIIPRDRHAAWFSVIGIIAGSVERLAVEIRHLQRSEVREVEEYFAKGQKGSSAMPHKRNPILTENLTGLSRIARAAVTPSLENIALWHERDISHSSVERVFAPDTSIAIDFALARLAEVIQNLIIYPENMLSNMKHLGGLIHSQKVLLALVNSGMSRESAYKVVQKTANKVWVEGGSFESYLYKESSVTKRLSKQEIKELFKSQPYVKNVNTIFKRVFNK
jgi:adenylosuccinate lyase